MINAISPVNVNKGSYASFKGNEALTGQPDKKTVTSAQKAMIGLSAAAAIVVGGLLVKRHFDVKLSDKALSKVLFENPVEKIKFFGKKEMYKILKGWEKSGIEIKDGDKFMAIPKSKIPSFAEYLKNTGCTESAKAVLQKYKDISDKGCLVYLSRQSDPYLSDKTLKYIEPQKCVRKVQRSFQNAQLYTKKLGVNVVEKESV